MKDIVDKLNFNKSKHFCFAQDTVKRIEKVTDQKKVFARDNLIKDYTPKYTNNSSNLIIRKQPDKKNDQ